MVCKNIPTLPYRIMPVYTSLRYTFSIDLFIVLIVELMKIHIHVIHSKRVIDCEMRNTSTVRDIKKKVQENIGVTTATKLVLISGGVELKDDCLLCHCSAYCDHSTLQLMLPMTSMYK